MTRAEKKKLANKKRSIIRQRVRQIALIRRNGGDVNPEIKLLYADYKGETHLIDQVLNELNYKITLHNYLRKLQ